MEEANRLHGTASRSAHGQAGDLAVAWQHSRRLRIAAGDFQLPAHIGEYGPVRSLRYSGAPSGAGSLGRTGKRLFRPVFVGHLQAVAWPSA